MDQTIVSNKTSGQTFMQLDLQNVPKHVTKVTFHQQQYRLVPDLSPDLDDCEDILYDKKDYEKPKNFQTPLPLYKVNTDQSRNCLRKRRQLPEIPAGKKPLEKLWKKEMNRIDSGCTVPLSVEIKNSETLSSAQTESLTPTSSSTNLRWTRKLSTNMLLEIETDPDSGRALSLRLLNKDDEDQCGGGGGGKSKQFMPEIYETMEQLPYNHSPAGNAGNFQHGNEFFSTQSGESSLSSQNVNNTITNSDSGVSSNLQSPTVSTSDSIDCDCDLSNVTDKQQTPINKSRKLSLRSLQLPEATHRALYRFCARHSDEIDLEIGDAIFVEQEYDDQWSSGLNLRTGLRGIFPSSLVTDVEYSEFTIESGNLQQSNLFPGDNEGLLPPINCRIKRERYLLDFMGSIEVNEPKGDEVLNEAISRISMGVKPTNIGIETPYKCVLEISDIGVRMMDDQQSVKSKSNCSPTSTTNTKDQQNHRHDYFFSLLQLTYCGYQLKNNQYYFAFITRHPSERSRYACHVFQATDTTRDIAESVGRAFHRFYNRFVEITLPIETFYLDN